MNNVSGATEVAISVFGGLNTELSPTDLPQGLSPDCKDMAFLPGSVFTRPPLKRFLTVPGNAQVVYATSFVKNDGTVVQFLLDSLGRFWANGVPIGQTAAGNRVKTCAAFGRLYIAVSDGLHGSDVPLQYDGTCLDRISQDGPAAAPTVSNYALPAVSLVSLSRNSGVVTATASGIHGLRVGDQALISSVTAQSVGGGITSIVIDNVAAPNVATVTTGSAHGLVPGDSVTISNVTAVGVGGGLSTTTILGGIATSTTNSAHGMSVGDQALVSLGSGDPTPALITSVPSTTTFVFGTTLGNTTTSGGSVQVEFPLSSDPTQNIYEVSEAPTSTTFQVPISYPNGTWHSGTITFAWNGTYYVASVPSATTLTYSQAGPDGTASGGTLTPSGQIAPGARGVVCIFQTRTGYLTAPSPSVSFTADGGQYVQVTNIPIGPSNVVARIIAFTGANGGRYFYLPIAPQLNGVIQGTSTVINDNTTTNIVFDFSDESLLAGSSIDVPGNDLFNQTTLGPVLGTFAYAGRLFAWGERNKIQQFLNMGFEGGSNGTQPLGWTISGTGVLATGGAYGQSWQITDAVLSQSAFQDQYGIAILQPNTRYTFRAWVNGTATAEFYSASAGLLASASIASGSGGFSEAGFSAKTPAVIPSDTVLRVRGGNGSILDELEIYYTDNPYLRTVRASYVDNPEAFDGVTGLIGPANDPNEVRALFERKDVLHFLTSGPNGSLYEAQDTPSGEPSTWSIQHIAAKCGAVSVWGDAQFEDWQVWASDTGLRIYDGGFVEKMSQEVQPWWDSFNPLAKQFTVVANDPYQRRILVLACTEAVQIPNSTYQLDYRELNTAAALESSGSLRIGMGGKVFTTDLTRKWSPWSITANFCGLMNNNGVATMTFCGGTGTTLTDPGYGAVYTLDEGSLAAVDDDYGAFSSYYTTYYFISQDEAQQMRLGTHRKLFTYLTASISGLGTAFVTPLVDRAGFQWRSTRPWTLQADPNYDFESPLNISGDRVAFQVNGSRGFYLTNLVVAMKDHPFAPIRGANG